MTDQIVSGKFGPFAEPMPKMLHELGDVNKDRTWYSLLPTGLTIGTLHGFILWVLGTAVSWGMRSVGAAALVGFVMGIWHSFRQRVIVPIALICWSIGALLGTHLFLRMGGHLIDPLSGVVAWMMGATVARTVTRTMTHDEQQETAASACAGGMIAGLVGWPLGATIVFAMDQYLIEPWNWIAAGASAAAVIGMLELSHRGPLRMAGQAILKAIAGTILVTCAFYVSGPLGWVAGASLIWMCAVAFFLPLNRHTASVLSVAVSPNGGLALSGSADKTARIWLLDNGQQVAYLDRRREHSIGAVAFSNDGAIAISGDDEGWLRVVDGQTGHETWTAHAHNSAVRCVAVAPNDARILTAGDDGDIHMWDIESGEHIRDFTAHNGSVHSIAFSPNGPYILSGGADGTMRLWNLDTGVEITSIADFTAPVHAVLFAPDGNHVVVSDDDAIHVWQIHNKEKVRSLHGHDGPALTMALVPDSTQIISGGGDGTVRIWDFETGEELGTLSGHDGPVRSVAVDEDGVTIVTGSDDCTVRIAYLDEDSEDDEQEEESDDQDSIE